jgi:hypothetical protein
MRIRQLVLLVCATGALTAYSQQPLVCPPGTAVSGKACETFHYHVATFRPDTRKFFEATGVNDFATVAACERARDEHTKRNLAVVDYFKRVKGEQQYEPDRFGPCHCDMTREKTNPAFLSDAQRQMQIRTVEDIRLRVREKLLDSGLPSDSELVRSLVTPPATLPALGGSKIVALPTATKVAAPVNSPEDLRATATVDTRPASSAAFDMPLVDVDPTIRPLQNTQIAAEPLTAPASGAPPQEIVATEPDPGAAEAAEEFISYETDRIQRVLGAAGAISDADLKGKIIEAAVQRGQLLSNLRSLIEGSGASSRLAAAVRSAKSESDHLALAERLFGNAMGEHWGAKDAADVVLPPLPEIDAEPERVLRDTTGKFDAQQKKRALYAVLARSQPTDEQQLWLVTVIDTFLR